MTAAETLPGAPTLDQRLMSVPIGNVHPDPDNPRTELGDLDELAASLESVGMLQPIIARRAGERLVVVAGTRRLAAARIAGWDKVPVIVRPPMRSDDVLAAMLVENSHRRDLDPIEEARALARLMTLNGLRSHTALAAKVGLQQAHVSKRLALLALSPAEQDEVRTGQMKLVEAVTRARISSGRVGVKRDPARLWFGATHELAAKAKARCTHLAHKRGYTLPGGLACGECWESVIRADERCGIAEHAAVSGHCTTCGDDQDDQSEINEVAVRRAADGEPTKLTRAETRAAVELLNRRGLDDRAIAERLNLTYRTVQRTRHRVGLMAAAPSAEAIGGGSLDEPDVDEVAVHRAADGDAVRLNRAEQAAAIELLNRRGLSDLAIAERLRISDRTVLRWRQRLGLGAVTA